MGMLSQQRVGAVLTLDPGLLRPHTFMLCGDITPNIRFLLSVSQIFTISLFAMLVVHPASICDVCLDPYSITTEPANSPHVIACGHIFCLTCVSAR